MAHPLQNKWLTPEQIEAVKKELYENFPLLRKAEFVNKPDDGLINVFELEVNNNDVFQYYRLDGSLYTTAREMWDQEREMDI